MKYTPQKVSKIDQVFGGGAMKLLPPMAEIPDQFKNFPGTPWNRLVSKLFFNGGSIAHLQPKDGINKQDAIAHISTCLGSFEPKHEHKEAGCAYLFSIWFEEPTVEAN